MRVSTAYDPSHRNFKVYWGCEVDVETSFGDCSTGMEENFGDFEVDRRTRFRDF